MPPANPIEKYCQRARQAIEGRDWAKAKQSYLQALGIRSDLPDVHYGLATVYFHLRELTSAAHHFREVTRLDPLRAGASINLGAVLNLLQQYDEAITALRRGLQIDPTRMEGYYNLGLVYRRKGQFDLAILAYQESLRLNPRMPDAHLNLGNCYFELKQYRQAIQHYEKALELKPEWDKPMDGIAHVRALMNGGPASPGGAAAPPPAKPGADLERMINPATHHDYLTELHSITVQADENGQELAQILLKEVEPAIKELSTCLLYSNRSRTELQECISKFESALDHMNLVQQAIQSNMGQIREHGEIVPT